MPIQWFPGHMHSTRKAIVERLPDIDVVIELLDARLPGSSGNPLLAALTAGKPALKVLNKQDLADPALNASGTPWSTLYYQDNYPRLQRIKARWDPRDVFRHALGVRPAR